MICAADVPPRGQVSLACRNNTASIELIVVDPSNRKQPPLDSAPPVDESAEAAAERRRIARVVHDERGTARVEWHNAPADYERPKLEVEHPDDTIRRLAILTEGGGDPFNPYNRKAEVRRTPPAAAPKRDLRKLSEWIKMMRGLQERRGRGDEDDETGS